MPYCYKCGVKLDEDAKICPLCGTKIPENTEVDSKDEKKGKNEPLYPIYDEYSKKQKISTILEIISVSFFIAIASIVVINLVLEGKINWSKIPSVSIFFIWLLVCSILLFYDRFIYLTIFIFIFVFGYLVSLDSLDKKLTWSIGYGLPILLSISILSFFTYLIISKLKQKGLNIFAYFLLAGCLLCFLIDTIINFNRFSIIKISWSKFVSFAVIPMSLFLLYLHHRFSTKLPGKRIFRI